jgi:L-amino acid N-acyltransferase YncA
MNVEIRSMIYTDYEQVHTVDILTQKQYLGDKFDRLNKDEQDSHLVSRKSEFDTNIETGYCFVAHNDKKIIGFILAHETLPFHGTLYVRYIGIDPDFQGKGIGLLLYYKLIEKARQTGIKEVQALINTDNPWSIKLHEKTGFSLINRKEAVLQLRK